MVSPEQLGCPRCAKPTQDGLICSGCLLAFERAVADLGVLLPELATTVGKLDEVSRGIRHSAPRARAEATSIDATGPVLYALANHGMPINSDAVTVATKVRYTLTTWVAHLRRRYGDPAGWFVPADPRRHAEGPACISCGHSSCVEYSRTATRTRTHLLTGPACDDGLRCTHPTCDRIRAGRLDVTTWLLASSSNVRRDDAAAAIVTDLVKAARLVEETVDRRDPEVYVGPCDQPDVTPEGEEPTGLLCGVDLYARVGDTHADCPACGARYFIAARRRFMTTAARDVWARPALIATALAAMDIDLTAARLDTWISRDKRRHQRDCVSRRLVGPRCAQSVAGGSCLHDTCTGLNARPWECWRGHILPVTNEEGGPVSDRAMYRVGDVLDRVEKLRAARDAQLEQEAI